MPLNISPKKTILAASALGLMLIIIALSFYSIKNTTLSYNINLPNAPEMTQTTFTYGEQPALSNPDFFGRVRKEFVDSKVDFIEANLSTLVMRVYKAGQMTLEVPIVTKGREGSWWETPAGLYKIGLKEKAHFSSLGRVWMPWSMSFQGNFFIHGRTYYNDGTPTSAQYTGGCIRLSTEDAKQVYDLVKVGTPVLVFEQSFASDSFIYPAKVWPNLSAKAYISADLRNNHVFASREPAIQVPIASITKLMTALIAIEYINLDNIATVSKEALPDTSKPRFEAGQKYKIYDLLFPLLMESSNEAAEIIARHLGRVRFIELMNQKSLSIGMLHTRFADPSGISAENVSTVEDLFMLAKYIYNNRSFVFKITSGQIKESAYGKTDWSDLDNFNNFIENQYFVGGKNGKTTAAAETNLSIFEFPVGNTTRPFAIIVLGARDVKNESQILLDYTMNSLP